MIFFAEEDGLINSLFEHELNGLRPIDTFDGPAIITPWIELQPHDFHDRCRFWPDQLFRLCRLLDLALDSQHTE